MSFDTLKVLMFVSKLRFYGCCHPCFCILCLLNIGRRRAVELLKERIHWV